MTLKTNTIYCGDCQKILAQFPEKSVDLIYVDPPFFSNRLHEVIWGDGYELRAFEDRWRGGIENYVAWMEHKIRECHRVLKNTGSMYLHCDWHADAHLRILMDKIFDERKFLNEIIWHYGAKASQKYPAFQRKHDTILLYSKNKKFVFNRLLQEYSEGTLAERETRFKHEDEKGRYRLTTRRNSGGKKYRAKVYLHKGVPMDDVWDIPIINATAKERLGYPTQKPELLLERIIESSSTPTDIILDPMCGCGTAIAVAHKLGRQWVGVDVSPTACKLMTDRMRKLGVSIGYDNIVGLPRTIEEIKAMQPFEFQNWVCEKLLARVSAKKTGDMGIDGHHYDGRPIQIKQTKNVGRNVVDNFETAMRRDKKKQGIVVAFSFGRGAWEEVARAKLHDELEIELKTVEEIIREE